MAARRPSFQWYSADWLKDPAIRAVSLEARGLWIDILCLMDQSPRRGYLQHPSGKLVTADQLARMTGCSTDDASRLLQELDNAGVFSSTESGVIYCRRMVRDEMSRQEAREYGLKGGNPTLMGRDNHNVKPPDKGGIEEEREDESTIKDRCLKIYAIYPKKIARASALKAIRKALGKVDFDALSEAVTAYASARQHEDPQFTPHPATWFNQERWNDDRSTWKPMSNRTGPGQQYDSGSTGVF